jgi:tight adherence protein B
MLSALNNPAVLVAVVGVGATAVALTLAVLRTVQNPIKRQRFEHALAVINSSELDLDTALNTTEKTRRSWSQYWAETVAQSGRPVTDPAGPGRIALGGAFFAAVFGLLVFPGGPVGFVAAPLMALAGYRGWLNTERKKRVGAMERQLPQLLSGMRANLQAGATPAAAIRGVAQDLPAPLGDEMRQVKRDLDVNVPLDAALGALADRVPSREMKFLVASIEIAVRSGADLDPQLQTIEGIVEQRTRIRQKLRSAVAQVKPTKALAYAAVPLMFVMSLREPDNQAFWFGSGLLMLIIASVLYLAGGFVIRLMVNSVENH